MMKDVSILIPYKSDNGPRDAAFTWVKKFYETLMPEAELCIGYCYTKIFSRAQAINDAAKKATRNIYVIADSDIFYNPDNIAQSIQLLDQYAWVIPYSKVYRISQQSTTELLKTSPSWPIHCTLETTIKGGFQGGINVIPRKNFEAVGGFDWRFCGWGGEDDSFAFSLNTLCGEYKRLNSEIYHLWHPRRSGQRGLEDYKPIYTLFQRYHAANGNKDAILALIKERETDFSGPCNQT